MRLLVVCLAFGLAALSGCANEDPGTHQAGDDPLHEAGTNVTVPQALQFSGSLQSVAAPTGDTTGCGPTGAGCATHSFSIEDELMVTITLASNDGTVTGTTAMIIWGTDYDMTLRDSGGELATSTNPGDQDDVIATTLQPGEYDVDVLAWNDQDGDYVLDIEFALPG